MRALYRYWQYLPAVNSSNFNFSRISLYFFIVLAFLIRYAFAILWFCMWHLIMWSMLAISLSFTYLSHRHFYTHYFTVGGLHLLSVHQMSNNNNRLRVSLSFRPFIVSFFSFDPFVLIMLWLPANWASSPVFIPYHGTCQNAYFLIHFCGPCVNSFTLQLGCHF